MVTRPRAIPSSEITPKAIYLRRREFIAAAGAALAALATGGIDTGVAAANALTVTKNVITTTDPPTPYNVGHHLQQLLRVRQQQERSGGERQAVQAHSRGRWRSRARAASRAIYTLEDILKPHPLEERVYRHRCVEGWSMVIPWVGFPLGDLLKRFEPTGQREVRGVHRPSCGPSEMPGQRGRFLSLLPWPYGEGLRMDEAMHPLTLRRGRPLRRGAAEPERRAAPPRRAVEVRLQEHQVDRQDPLRREAADDDVDEAGAGVLRLLANVNPASTNSTFRDQANERRLGEFLDAQDAAVQRLRRSGRVALRRNGSSKELLA